MKAKRKILRVTKKPRRFGPNKLLEAKQTQPVSQDLAYKVTGKDDTGEYELFTKHPYAAAIAQQALADRTGNPAHIMLGSRSIDTEQPKRRRKMS